MKLYLSLYDDVGDVEHKITRKVEIHDDYNFDQIGEIVRSMAETIAPTPEDEAEQMKGEARSDEERGN